MLDFRKTQVTDAGLANFADCQHLQLIGLSNFQLTDNGLSYLQSMKSLQTIVIRPPDDEVNAKRLAEVFPRCRIIYDGGVIEPH